MIIQPTPPLTALQTEFLAEATKDIRPEIGFAMEIAVILDRETIVARVVLLDDGVLVNEVRVIR
jgi:hypothetical protein